MSKILPAFFVETLGAETEQDVIDAMYDMAETLNDLYSACTACDIKIPLDVFHGRGKPQIDPCSVGGYTATRRDYDGAPDANPNQTIMGVGNTPEEALTNLQWNEVDQGLSLQM